MVIPLKFLYALLSLVTLCLLTACTPINNIEPFDQKQAALLVQSWVKQKSNH